MTHRGAIAIGPGSLRFRRLLVLALLLGCGHTDPFSAPPFDRNQPFNPTPPVRLTLNRGADRRPAWLADGSAILYSMQPFERRDNDVCLALLPAGGGSQRQLTCNLDPTNDSRTDASESAAASSDGRLAYVAATSAINAAVPLDQGIVLAAVNDPLHRRVLLSVPYTVPGGRTHGGVSQIRWLGPNRLLYLGEAVSVITPCQFCEKDTVRSGLDAVSLGVDGTPASPQAVPGTDLASGVSPGASEDEIYYTLAADPKVYRRVLSTGEVSVVHDFGAAGVARDVHVVGSRMAAVVGGRVAFTIDPSLGPTQWDSGGALHVVNLQDGTDMTIDGPGLFRRPQLSPSGTGIVAEVFPLILTPLPLGAVDTTVSRVGDLYTFGQP